MKNRIFSPYGYQGLWLRNRIVRSATNDYCGGADGSISAEQMKLYERLAKAEIGLIITGNFYVADNGRLDETQNSITADSFDVKGVSELIGMIHQNGAAVVLQVSHAGHQSKLGLSPDPLHLEQIAEDFAEASKRCRDAGADGVQIHFGHGYLLSELLEKPDGLRTAERVLKRVRERVDDYPVLVKVNSDIEPKRFAGFCEMCGRYHVWAVELSGSDFYARRRDERNYYEKSIQTVLENSDTPVVLTGGIRSLRDGEQALNAGAELIGMSRPFISEPELVTKKWKAKSQCISCCQCFRLYKETGKRCVFETSIQK